MKLAIVSILLFGGLFFFGVGTVGILRFPDLYTRIHGAAKCDTLGVFLSLTALMVYSGVNYSSMKLLLVILFLWLTNPAASHLIAKAQYYKNHDKVSE